MRIIDYINKLINFNLSNPSQIEESNSITDFENKLFNGSFEVLQTNGFSSMNYILKSNISKNNYILKLRKLNSLNGVPKLKSEILAFSLLKSLITVPINILYSLSDGYEISIYEYLEGVDATEIFLDLDQLHIIFNRISVVQYILNINRNKFALETNTKFGTKIEKMTFNSLKRKLCSSNINSINSYLNNERINKTNTVFSDRSPANWIIRNEEIIPIDFELLLYEPSLSDYVQFVDDSRLATLFSRDQLITICLKYLESTGTLFTKEDFHWVAIYRNLIQAAVLYDTNKKASKHYYERALLSSAFVGLNSLQFEISDILNSKKW